MIQRLAHFLRKRGLDFEAFGTVFDVGSRDALQAVELAELFPRARVVAIECNPGTLELCRRNIAPHPRITLIEKAIHSYTGRCQFHPIDPERTITTWADGNPGASSLFLATGDYPAEQYAQNTIEVDCIRLDHLCGQLGIGVIDLIWMDLQGAELLALQSAGSLLEKTRFIYTEVSHRPLYRGQCLFEEVDAFLTARGFRCWTKINRDRWQQDLIYENSRYAIDAVIPPGPEREHAPAAERVRSEIEPRREELRLLLACGRLVARDPDDATIRKMLEVGIDWTSFVSTAIQHGMGGMAAHHLLRVAPDLIPVEIADALRMHLEERRRSSAAGADELARVLKALTASGIDTIALKGPVLALRVYGDLGLRVFRDLDFLVHDEDMSRTMDLLLALGYRRETTTLSRAQIEMIQYLQGQDFVYSESGELGIEPHIRLTPAKIALDVDYAGLWRRAREMVLNGVPIRVLEPEDDFIALAIHGGKELWWNLKWVCDIALFIDAHPSLDWSAVLARARAQGCLRMVLLAVSLAETFFRAAPPEGVMEAACADARIAILMSRILERWESGGGAPSNSLSRERVSLHDGLVRRIRYIVRTPLLPGPQHVAAMALPRSLHFAYVPITILHDTIALPLWKTYRGVLTQVTALKERLIASHFMFALALSSHDERSRLRGHERARRRARSALAENPNEPGTWCELGEALAGLKRHAQALECYEKALTIAPERMHAWRGRGAALAALGRNSEAEEPSANPADANGWARRAGFLFVKRRYIEAAAASDCALELDPDHLSAMRIGINSRMWACDWHCRESDVRRIITGYQAGYGLTGPIDFRRLCPSEGENFTGAKMWARSFPAYDEPMWSGEQYSHERIRIAYMSADFRNHVVSETIVGCIEHHDRSRFETTAISLLDGDGSDMRRRVEQAFDRVIDVSAIDDVGAARAIRELEIDILIDLNGYAGMHRTRILAHRPAPVQVNYLGFPGTTAASFMDYIVADRFVIPEENRGYFTEKLVRLPHSYMPLDDRRGISSRSWTRTQAGLPEKAFVFACHNDERKLGPEMFRLWMRLLLSVEHSVLWLKSMNSSAIANLRREAASCGVAPDRLIIAPRLARGDDHLARLGLADLFLDTLPYNAHATACDALWVGLPLITCRGEAFPGLVASGILIAAGMPELVTSSLEEYEALARALAHNPARLAAIRAKLARARESAPLFDTAGYTRHLESAYARMWERQRAGLPPAPFDVAISGDTASSDLERPELRAV